MSYCQFENTYKDLLQCLNNMNNELSERETGYKERLVDVCREIIDEYELNKMSDDEWGFDIVELESDGEDNTQNNNDDEDGSDGKTDYVPWDLQTK